MWRYGNLEFQGRVRMDVHVEFCADLPLIMVTLSADPCLLLAEEITGQLRRVR